MKAVAYARYSTSHQNETSITAQLEAIQSYCDRNGIELTGTSYVDEAFSGTNTDRPAYQRLLRDAASHRFDAIVVYDISRGSRDVADWFAFRKQMSDLGITVLSATNTLGDMDDPNAFLQELLTVGLGQHMILQTRQKSIAGKRVRAQSGLFCGGVAPLGYSIVSGRYVVDEAEAVAVRLIFSMYNNGSTYGEIIDELDRIHFRTRSGKRLERNTLYFILNNRRYTGSYIWFDRTERHMHKHVGADNPDKIIIDDVIPSIVSKEEFELASQRMEKSRQTFGINHSKYPFLLSGLIRCGDCGGAMCGANTRSKGHSYPRYICSNKRKEKSCRMPDVKADVLDDFIFDQLRSSIANEEVIKVMAKYYADKLATETSMADSIRREMKALERKNARETDVALEMGLTPEIKKRLMQNEAYRQQLEEKLASVVEPPVLSAEEIENGLRADMQRFSDTMSEEDKRELVRRYVVSVLIYRNDIEINFSPVFSSQNEQTPDGIADECLQPAWLPRYAPFFGGKQRIPRAKIFCT